MSIDVTGRRSWPAAVEGSDARSRRPLSNPASACRFGCMVARPWPPLSGRPPAMARSPCRRLHLSDAVAISRYIGEAAGALLRVDILVNNASRFGPSDDETGWAASILVDRLATVRASRAALPFLVKSDGARSSTYVVRLSHGSPLEGIGCRYQSSWIPWPESTGFVGTNKSSPQT
jgi:NAD(P)-dependent dehydrogenase (short-subunit alcohol dehydrogenase family)